MIDLDYLYFYILLGYPLVLWAWLWWRARNGLLEILLVLPKPVLIFNKGGNVVWWNDKAERDFPDWCFKEINIKHLEGVTEPVWMKVVSSLKNGIPTFKLPLLKVLDENFNKSIMASCALMPFDKRKIIAIMEDVTKETDIEERLIQVDKLSTLGLLSSSMVHDINNGLSGISQSIQNIQRKLTQEYIDKINTKEGINLSGKDMSVFLESSKVDKSLSNIATATNQISSIVDSILHFSRSSSESSEEVNIQESIKSVFNIILMDNSTSRALKSNRLSINFEPIQLPVIKGTKIKIEQVIMNLVQNAIHAAMSYSDAPSVDLITEFDDDFITLRVRDNGAGIHSTELRKIFKPFYTTKKSGVGTGLGLYICHQIVCEHHNGEIEVDSVVGRGAEFTIKLPR